MADGDSTGEESLCIHLFLLCVSRRSPRPEPYVGVLPGGLGRRRVLHRAGVGGAGAGEDAGPRDPGLLPAPGSGHGPGRAAGGAGLTGELAPDKMSVIIV